jgi:hypothetical protein
MAVTTGWQAGSVAPIAGLWTAVIYFKSRVLAGRPALKLLVANVACVCLIAAVDREHGPSPPITDEVDALEPITLAVVLGVPGNGAAASVDVMGDQTPRYRCSTPWFARAATADNSSTMWPLLMM